MFVPADVHCVVRTVVFEIVVESNCVHFEIIFCAGFEQKGLDLSWEIEYTASVSFATLGEYYYGSFDHALLVNLVE